MTEDEVNAVAEKVVEKVNERLIDLDMVNSTLGLFKKLLDLYETRVATNERQTEMIDRALIILMDERDPKRKPS